VKDIRQKKKATNGGPEGFLVYTTRSFKTPKEIAELEMFWRWGIKYVMNRLDEVAGSEAIHRVYCSITDCGARFRGTARPGRHQNASYP